VEGPERTLKMTPRWKNPSLACCATRPLAMFIATRALVNDSLAPWLTGAPASSVLTGEHVAASSYAVYPEGILRGAGRSSTASSYRIVLGFRPGCKFPDPKSAPTHRSLRRRGPSVVRVLRPESVHRSPFRGFEPVDLQPLRGARRAAEHVVHPAAAGPDVPGRRRLHGH